MEGQWATVVCSAIGGWLGAECAGRRSNGLLLRDSPMTGPEARAHPALAGVGLAPRRWPFGASLSSREGVCRRLSAGYSAGADLHQDPLAPDRSVVVVTLWFSGVRATARLLTGRRLPAGGEVCWLLGGPRTAAY